MKTLLESKIFLSKMTVFIFVILFGQACLRAQQIPVIEWQKCLGGSNQEDSDHMDIGKSIIKTIDGGYIIVGGTKSNDGDISGNHGLDDAWMLKVTSAGSIVRQKCFGGSCSEEASCIINTSDNGYAIAGQTNSNDGDVSGFHGGYKDIWVVKLDDSWNIQWQKCIGGTGWDWTAGSIIQTSDGGYAISGTTTSTDEGFFNRGNGDAYIVKLNSSGEMQWQKCFGGTEPEGSSAILQTSDRGFIFAGTTFSNDSDVSGNYLDSTGMPTGDVWIVKIDSTGKIQWQKCFGGSGTEYSTSFIKTSDGGYALTGCTFSTDGDVVGHHTGFPNNSDAWVIKFDSACNIVWQKCLGGSGYDGGYSIIQTYEGGYAICGTTESNDGDVTGYHGGYAANLFEDSSDVWVVKLSPSGVIEWQKCLGGTQTDFGFAITQTFDGGFAIHGRTNSTDGDVSGNHGKEDMWVVKLSAVNVSVESGSIGSSNFAWVYPNPSIDQIHLQLYHSMPVTQMQFYNLLGVQYFPEYQIENTTATVDVHSLPVGSYMVRILYTSPGGGEIAEVQKFLHFH